MGSTGDAFDTDDTGAVCDSDWVAAALMKPDDAKTKSPAVIDKATIGKSRAWRFNMGLLESCNSDFAMRCQPSVAVLAVVLRCRGAVLAAQTV